MPSTIPYDPSLILGNIVSEEKLENIIQISKLQAPADAAESEMNSFIALKRSVDMTIQEAMGMGINVDDITKESEAIGKQLQEAMVAYAKAKIAAAKAIQPLKAKINTVNKAVESPIDYNKSGLMVKPLAADTMNMNVQYFAFDGNSQSSASHAATISTFVAESTRGVMSPEQSGQASTSAQSQMNSQHSNHSISGTLVISITCTHKNVQVLAPYILDVDKAVNSWNALYPDNMIQVTDPSAVAAIQAKAYTKEDKAFTILSGASFGSSFVGMVHVLNTTDSSSSQSMESIASSLQATFTVGNWVSENSGQFGVSDSFSNSAKNLLSTQNVTSHATLICMGIMPSITSNQVSMAVDSFSDFSPDKAMENLAKLQGATSSSVNTLASGANKAKTGQQMIELKNATVQSTLSAVSKVDGAQNKIIDTNSMMIALEDYIKICKTDDKTIVGLPINYYLKEITQSEIARAWTAKYFPNDFNKAGSADDSADAAKDAK